MLVACRHKSEGPKWQATAVKKFAGSSSKQCMRTLSERINEYHIYIYIQRAQTGTAAPSAETCQGGINMQFLQKEKQHSFDT